MTEFQKRPNSWCLNLKCISHEIVQFNPASETVWNSIETYAKHGPPAALKNKKTMFKKKWMNMQLGLQLVLFSLLLYLLLINLDKHDDSQSQVGH